MFIDTHLHLNSEKYSNINEIIERANLVNVKKFITIGTTQEEFPEILNLTKHNQVYGTLGIYPTYDNDISITEAITAITKNLNQKIVGIGECGFNQPIKIGERSIIKQEELFRTQIELANQLKLPVVVHTRNSDNETLKVLQSYKNTNLRGVIHCFVSDYDFAKKILDLGFYLSFNGIITYNSGVSIHETIKNMPLDRILLETDAPWLPVEGYRSLPNEPRFIPLIAQKIAEIRNTSVSLAEIETYKNSINLFDKITP